MFSSLIAMETVDVSETYDRNEEIAFLVLRINQEHLRMITNTLTLAAFFGGKSGFQGQHRPVKENVYFDRHELNVF